MVLQNPGTILKINLRGGRISPILYLDTFSGHLFLCLRKLQKPFEELPSLNFVNNFSKEDHIRGIRHKWLEILKVIIYIQIFIKNLF